MCTVSFIPTTRGFYLAMNRDERIAREAGLPPRMIAEKGCRALYPSEPSGGTWISVNEHGVCLALVNWHRVERVPPGELVSRGEVVKALATAGSLSGIDKNLRGLPLSQMRPFRLMAVANSEQRVGEYRWNLKKVSTRRYGWTRRHWFSSGYDEQKATRVRTRICQQAWRQDNAGSLKWLRELHASHLPERGPFSVCMHQAMANTVSYTEVAVENQAVIMIYKAGPACSAERIHEVILGQQNKSQEPPSRV
jgi:hypothetical protein